jgi:hypothetical protein
MKTIKFFSKFTAAAFLLGICSVFASAQATDTNALTMSATVVSSVKLNIENNAGVTFGGSDEAWTVNLGNVSGLGLGTPAAGVTAASVTGGWNYSTAINVTPVYSGFGDSDATVEVTSTGADEAIALEGTSTTGTGLSPSDAVVSAEAATDVALPRVVGFFIAQNETAGAKTATLTYTVTINP